MLTLRPFCNADCRHILRIWEKKTSESPDLFVPMAMETLESQILGNILFDPAGLFLVFDGSEAIGFIHASFTPDPEGNGPTCSSGILFSPVVALDVPNRKTIITELIAAGEQYLLSYDARRWYFGGYANASPFYTGLYTRCNPEGICGDAQIVEALMKTGYQSFGTSRLFRLNLGEYQPTINQKIHEAHHRCRVQKMPGWRAPNWWEANIYRNFISSEWNVFLRDEAAGFPEPVAGILFHRMQKSLYSPRTKDDDVIHLILSYIGVIESQLRTGIASLLFSIAASEILSEEFLPVVVDTIVPDEDTRLAPFLRKQGFFETAKVCSFFKTC